MKLKLTLILILAACALTGQADRWTGTHNTPGTGSITSAASEVQPSPAYFVEYTTQDSYYECGYTYAVYCPGDPGCGVPWKTVTHFEPFATQAAALDFLNTMAFGKFVRLLKATEIPVKQSKQLSVEPQPPKVTETTKYRIADKW